MDKPETPVDRFLREVGQTLAQKGVQGVNELGNAMVREHSGYAMYGHAAEQQQAQPEQPEPEHTQERGRGR